MLYLGPLLCQLNRREDQISGLYICSSVCMLSVQPQVWLQLTKCPLQFSNIETEKTKLGGGGGGGGGVGVVLRLRGGSVERDSVITGETESRLAAVRAPWSAVSDLPCPPRLARPAATNHQHHPH